MGNLSLNYSDEGSQASPQGSFPITPSDSADISVGGVTCLVKGLFLDVAGNVKVTWDNGMDDTLAMPAGGSKMRVRRVWATGTTATGIHGLV